MGRLLVFVLLGLVAYLLIRGLTTSASKSVRPRAGKGNRKPGMPMKRCHHCGVYAPESEMVVRADHTYCSEAHSRADQGETDRK